MFLSSIMEWHCSDCSQVINKWISHNYKLRLVSWHRLRVLHATNNHSSNLEPHPHAYTTRSWHMQGLNRQMVWAPSNNGAFGLTLTQLLAILPLFNIYCFYNIYCLTNWFGHFSEFTNVNRLWSVYNTTSVQPASTYTSKCFKDWVSVLLSS